MYKFCVTHKSTLYDFFCNAWLALIKEFSVIKCKSYFFIAFYKIVCCKQPLPSQATDTIPVQFVCLCSFANAGSKPKIPLMKKKSQTNLNQCFFCENKSWLILWCPGVSSSVMLSINAGCLFSSSLLTLLNCHKPVFQVTW